MAPRRAVTVPLVPSHSSQISAGPELDVHSPPGLPVIWGTLWPLVPSPVCPLQRRLMLMAHYSLPGAQHSAHRSHLVPLSTPASWALLPSSSFTDGETEVQRSKVFRQSHTTRSKIQLPAQPTSPDRRSGHHSHLELLYIPSHGRLSLHGPLGSSCGDGPLCVPRVLRLGTSVRDLIKGERKKKNK